MTMYSKAKAPFVTKYATTVYYGDLVCHASLAKDSTIPSVIRQYWYTDSIDTLHWTSKSERPYISTRICTAGYKSGKRI